MNKFDAHILVVDDDEGIRNLVKQYLNENNYLITTADSAEDAKEKISIIKFDLIVLDVMMPGKSGLEFTIENKEKINTPIILLTAKGEAEERIEGLEVGADDYLPKPFNPRELLARVNAILRRQQHSSIQNTKDIFEFGNFSFDISNRSLHKNGQEIQITAGEYDLLRVFAERPKQPLSRDQIMQLAKGKELDVFDRSIDVQISRLRRLIEEDPNKPKFLQTKWGFGYIFIPDSQQD